MKKSLLLFSVVVIGVSAVTKSVEELLIREIVRYPTKEEMRADYLNRGKQLMALKDIPDGDETLVCTNWVCPTSIVVNAEQYLVETNKCLSLTYFNVLTTNESPVKVASGDIEIQSDGKVARCTAFAHRAQTSLYLPDYARGVVVQAIGSASNMLFVSYRSLRPGKMQNGHLAYKNITLEVNAQTNAVDFAAAIINAGLPEEERIPLPPTQ